MKAVLILLAATLIYCVGRAWLAVRSWRRYDRELISWRDSWSADDRD